MYILDDILSHNGLFMGITINKHFDVNDNDKLSLMATDVCEIINCTTCSLRT